MLHKKNKAMLQNTWKNLNLSYFRIKIQKKEITQLFKSQIRYAIRGDCLATTPNEHIDDKISKKWP